eukprot:464007-Alexandrium_andersonii.AAC.1
MLQRTNRRHPWVEHCGAWASCSSSGSPARTSTTASSGPGASDAFGNAWRRHVRGHPWVGLCTPAANTPGSNCAAA